MEKAHHLLWKKTLTNVGQNVVVVDDHNPQKLRKILVVSHHQLNGLEEPATWSTRNWRPVFVVHGLAQAALVVVAMMELIVSILKFWILGLKDLKVLDTQILVLKKIIFFF